MALILSIETSGKVCSVAITDSSNPIFYSEFQVQHSHAEVVNLLVNQAMETASLNGRDLSAIAVSIGPGSYTGLRIGLSTAKGFALAWDLPLISIESLLAMTLQVKEMGLPFENLVPMFDARRMEVFTATYSSSLECLIQPNAFIFDDNIPEDWFIKHQRSIFFGDGMPKAKNFLSLTKGSCFLEGLYPKADAVGKLAFTKLQNAEYSDLAYQEPFYVKPFYTTYAKQN